MKKYFVFIDDSGHKEPNLNSTPFFLWGAVLIKEESYQQINNGIDELKIKYFNTLNIEIKGSWLFHDDPREKHYLRPFKVKKNHIFEFIEELLSFINISDIKIFASIIDKNKLKTIYKYPFYSSSQAYEHLCQRLVNYNHSAEGEKRSIIICIDDMTGKSPGNREWKKLLIKKHEGLLAGNSRVFRPIDYSTIQREIYFKDSASLNMLQIADFCAFLTYNQIKNIKLKLENKEKEIDSRTQYFQKLWKSFHKKDGKVFNFGLVLFPR